MTVAVNLYVAAGKSYVHPQLQDGEIAGEATPMVEQS